MRIYKTQMFSAIDAALKIGISGEKLRYWEKLGIVMPKYISSGARKFRQYSEEDIHRAVLIKTLLETEKYTLEEAIRELEEEIVVKY